MKFICTLLLFHIITHIAFSQDLNFAQLQSNPVSLNPANAGLFSGKFRFGGQYKSQYGNFTTPFTSTAIHTDISVFRKGFGRRVRATGDWVGAGIQMSNDKAGDGKLAVNRVYAVGAYHKSLDKFQRKSISLGVQFGAIQRSIDFANLYLEDQWTGEKFNLTSVSIDYGRDPSKLNIDFAVGVQYNRILSNENQPLRMYSVGIALSHPLGVKTAFESFEETSLKPKPILNAMGVWSINKDVAFEPVFVAMRQNKSNFVMIGTNVSIKAQQNAKVFIGSAYKLNGDLVASAGFEYFGYRFTLGYDINLGPIADLTDGQGGLELSLLKFGPRPKGVTALEF